MGKGSSPKIEETKEQQELAAIAGEKYQYFESDLKQVRDVFIDDSLQANDASNYNKLNGTVKADAGSFLNGHLDGAESKMKASGIDPTSGRYQAGLGDVATAAAEIDVDTTTRSQSALQDSYVQGLGNLVAMGEKKSMQAIDGKSNIAAQSADHARQSVNDKINRNSDAKTGLGLATAVAVDTAFNKNKGG